MSWQWMALVIANTFLIPLVSGWYINRQLKRRLGEDLDRETQVNMIIVLLVLVWGSFAIGRWTTTW